MYEDVFITVGYYTAWGDYREHELEFRHNTRENLHTKIQSLIEDHRGYIPEYTILEGEEDYEI